MHNVTDDRRHTDHATEKRVGINGSLRCKKRFRLKTTWLHWLPQGGIVYKFSPVLHHTSMPWSHRTVPSVFPVGRTMDSFPQHTYATPQEL